MNSKIQKSILGGLIGTAIMTIVTMVASMMGMPKMSPPEMLAGMIGLPVFVGWIMHFMIGIMFATGYVFFFAGLLKTTNGFLKGALFGIAVFVFAQVMMFAMGSIMGGMPAPESPLLMMIGSFMGHIIYGIAVAKSTKL